MAENLANSGDIGTDLPVREELARFIASRRIPDLRGSAAHQHDRTVTRLLQAAQQHDLHQAADVQAVRGGVKSDISRENTRARPPVESRGIGLLMDVAALGQRAQEI